MSERVESHFSEEEVSKATVFEQATELNLVMMQESIFDSTFSVKREYQEQIDALNENAAIANLFGRRVEMYGERVYIPDVQYCEDGTASLFHIAISRHNESGAQPFEKGEFAGFGLQIIPTFEDEDDESEPVGYAARVCIRVSEEDTDVAGFEGAQFSYGSIDEVQVDFIDDRAARRIAEAEESLLSVKHKESARDIEKMKQLFSEIFDEDDHYNIENIQDAANLAKQLLKREKDKANFDIEGALLEWFEAQLMLKGAYVEVIAFTSANLYPVGSGGVECTYTRSKHINSIEVEGEVLGVALIPSYCVVAYLPLEAIAGIDVQIQG